MMWYEINNVEEIDSPSLVLYEKNLDQNLGTMIKMVDGDTSKLMPHIKTNKMPKVIERMISMDIKNFKSSTIAEAEIAAKLGAKSVLIAHQLVGPKIDRFAALITAFPETSFSTLLDNTTSAERLNEVGIEHNLAINVFIDINSGMDRSGIKIDEKLNKLIDEIDVFKNLKFNGLHIYDGHFRDQDFQLRKNKVEDEFQPVSDCFLKLKHKYPELQLVCGGTPTFTSHSTEKGRISSPGTCVFWDWNYDDKLLEQEFKFAVLLITRVISKPTEGIITLDMGHKSVAPENSIDRRIKFLNLENYELLSQSEEHGVINVDDWDAIEIGDVFYGVPYHICPTVNLHDYVSVISNYEKVDEWEILGRKRRINI